MAVKILVIRLHARLFARVDAHLLRMQEASPDFHRLTRADAVRKLLSHALDDLEAKDKRTRKRWAKKRAAAAKKEE